MRNYDDHVVGQVMSKIFAHHSETDTCNTLDEEAEKVYENITDKYNGQFNLKYSSASQLSASQPVLDLEEKSEICVRTKANELIVSSRTVCGFFERRVSNISKVLQEKHCCPCAVKTYIRLTIQFVYM